MPSKKEKILLITGGSGLIGRHLTIAAQAEGYKVRWLSRFTDTPAPEGVEVYGWNVNNKSMDYAAWEGVTHVVHLAGTNIGERPWSRLQKEAILKSRVRANQVLSGYASTYAHDLEAVVLASAIGYYGSGGGDTIWTEEQGPGKGFQSAVCIKWEFGNMESFVNLKARTTLLRIGVVLSKEGGALPRMLTPIKFGLGHLGNGRQWVSWISLRDQVRLILHALTNPKMEGVYNAVAPTPLTNAQLTRQLAKRLGSFIWFPAIPAFFLRIGLGEMSELVLGSIRCSAAKVLGTGFKFLDTELPADLDQL